MYVNQYILQCLMERNISSHLLKTALTSPLYSYLKIKLMCLRHIKKFEARILLLNGRGVRKVKQQNECEVVYKANSAFSVYIM